MSSAWQWTCTTLNDAAVLPLFAAAHGQDFHISASLIQVLWCQSVVQLPLSLGNSVHWLNSSWHGDGLCHMQCTAVLAMQCLLAWGKYLDPKAMPPPLVWGAPWSCCPEQQGAYPYWEQGSGVKASALKLVLECQDTVIVLKWNQSCGISNILAHMRAYTHMLTCTYIHTHAHTFPSVHIQVHSSAQLVNLVARLHPKNEIQLCIPISVSWSYREWESFLVCNNMTGHAARTQSTYNMLRSSEIKYYR